MLLHHTLTGNGVQSKKGISPEIPDMRDEDIQDGDEIPLPLNPYTNKIRDDEDSGNED